MYHRLYNIFIIWPFNWDFSGSTFFFSWHATAFAKISSSSSVILYDTFWALFSKCDETTDVNFKKDSSIWSTEDVRLIFFINFFGSLGDMSDEELRDSWFSSDKIFLLDDDIECAGEIGFWCFENVSECSKENLLLSLVNASGLCNEKKSSLSNNSVKENEENEENKNV